MWLVLNGLLVERLVHLVILWWTPSSSCHTWHSASLIRLLAGKSVCSCEGQVMRVVQVVWLAGNGPALSGPVTFIWMVWQGGVISWSM